MKETAFGPSLFLSACHLSGGFNWHSADHAPCPDMSGQGVVVWCAVRGYREGGGGRGSTLNVIGSLCGGRDGYTHTKRSRRRRQTGAITYPSPYPWTFDSRGIW